MDLANLTLLEHLRTPLYVFECPSDSHPEWNDKSKPNVKAKKEIAHSNDIGIMGSELSDPSGNGTLYQNSSVRMADILDGTSSTLLFGQRDYFRHRGSIWAGSTNHSDTNRNFLISQTADLTRINADHENAFSSLHSGGAQFAFADGSVHFVSETIDAKDSPGPAMGTWQRLGARNDNQPLGEF